MGYTTFTKQLVEKYIAETGARSIIDLGAQNDFSGPNLPAPYISEWYEEMALFYKCIDLNGENSSIVADLSTISRFQNDESNSKEYRGFTEFIGFDLVVDAGTSEHVGKDGRFSWEAIYNCWFNKWNLLKAGGVMINENPKSGHWEKHGFQWYVTEFYDQLSYISDLSLIGVGEVCAMGNCETGMNVWSVMKKTGGKFPSLEEFKTLPLKQS